MAAGTSWIAGALTSHLDRVITEQHDIEDAWQHIVDHAPTIVDCDAASIKLSAEGEWHTAVTSNKDVSRVDALQYELGEGPWIDANGHQHFIIRDVAADPRWPNWGPRAAALGAGALLAVHIDVAEHHVGALNLYSYRPRDYDADDVTTAYLLASHVALVLTSVLKVEGITNALESRSMIGQAQGIVMQRYDMNATHAWDAMVRTSQNANQKIRVLAQQIIRDRELPSNAH